MDPCHGHEDGGQEVSIKSYDFKTALHFADTPCVFFGDQSARSVRRMHLSLLKVVTPSFATMAACEEVPVRVVHNGVTIKTFTFSVWSFVSREENRESSEDEDGMGSSR